MLMVPCKAKRWAALNPYGVGDLGAPFQFCSPFENFLFLLDLPRNVIEVIAMCVRTTCSGVAIPGLWIVLAIPLCLSGCSGSSPSHTAKASANANPPSAAIAGYVWDSRVQGLRPLSGSLGAAHLEAPLAGLALRSATSCPSHGIALGSDAGGGVFAIGLPSGQPTKLGDAVAPDQQLTFSPSCADGLVYSPTRGSGLLITGLPSSPRVQSIALTASGPVSSAAISDSGAILVAAPKSDGTTALEMLSATGAVQMLPNSVQKVGGMAFLPGSDSAIVADSATSTIYFGKQLSSGPTFAAIAGSAQGVSSPRAVASSADGHFAFVANGAGNNLLRIDLTAAAAVVPIPCGCAPTELLPLAGNAGFQITDAAAGTIFALNGDGQTPRTVFIPTDTLSAARGGAQ